MTAIVDALRTVHRPRLLVRAARHGLEDYHRARDLRRVLKGERLPGPTEALPRLMDIEAAQEETRQSGDTSYSVARHLEILIALMAEARAVCSAPSSA